LNSEVLSSWIKALPVYPLMEDPSISISISIARISVKIYEKVSICKEQYASLNRKKA
jgi:hypothetical protein